jgi:hypothetical protein
MQPEDSQIDVLLKRYGREARSGASAEHLDADELNAFAERSAPESARSRYVSHLAECEDCRTLATQLSIAAGATANVGAGAIETESGSLWQKLTLYFAPPTLRYAAFAAVLVVAVGVTFLALRNQRDSAPVARNEPVNQAQPSAVKAPEPDDLKTKQTAQTFATPSGTVSQPGENATSNLKKDESKVVVDTAEPPQPQKEAVASAGNPTFAGKKAEPATVEQPSFAPPPPAEAGRAQAKSSEERDAPRTASVSGPRKSEPASDKFKVMDRSAGGISQTRGAEGEDNRAKDNQTVNQQSINQQATNQQATNQQATNQQATNQQNQGRMLDSNGDVMRQGNLAVNRARDDEGNETPRKPATGAARRESEKAPETRSARGHKFRRQGNAWVDSKFKSSMSITSVARGSDAFRALDPAVRSMAEQLGGEVIVVSKGKAYRIR